LNRWIQCDQMSLWKNRPKCSPTRGDNLPKNVWLLLSVSNNCPK
jgi:hypothetical protein